VRRLDANLDRCVAPVLDRIVEQVDEYLLDAVARAAWRNSSNL